MSPQFDILVEGLAFAEGIRFHDGRLWFSDMYDRRVFTVDAFSGELIRVVETPDRPSGIVVSSDGAVFVTQQVSRSVAHIDVDGTVSHFADLSSVADWHVNDMTAVPGGGLYVGNYGDESAPPAPPYPAELAFVARDGSVTAVASDLHFANGMAVVDDGRTLLVAETRSDPPRISAFDIAPDHHLSGRRTFAEFDGARMPDGIAALHTGEVLVAMPFSREIVLVSPAGEVARSWPTESIGMPYAVAVDADSGTGFAACSGAWEEKACLDTRDAKVVRFALG